ncbi:2-dehydropantoate 2-reductase [Burkholderia glumae]|uniref:2-dehydropantoate 2-reductase n=1 Tax=Burkholderia glumae TaxID=337 RepID=UPI00214A0CDE|nr:2-dehydropantoate 2-reductase [Burkholderia glumae]MCR1767136.1 2-dehydropantoate 2-reductase [Burkholderia glumae]UVS99764.1 2-dehydropantoate 2-reductase [Burkholderia glumae]
MRILIVGAGAVGGYFGGRLANAGRDVSFLVRPARAAQLHADGLVIRSPHGDLTLAEVKTVDAAAIDGHYDLIVLSCKAYSLAGAIASFAPAVGPATRILPLLNGMRHIDVLTRRFGETRVLGGQCVIAATLNEGHEIAHLNELHAITFGALAGGPDARVTAILGELSGAGFEVRADEAIRQRMWDKWVFLATLACSTTLCRASLGEILAAPDGKRLIGSIFDECLAIARHNGFAADAATIERATAMLYAPGSPMTASMLRDMLNGAPIEAAHVVGDLISRGGLEQHDATTLSLLRVAYANLGAYEARRAQA